MEVPLVRQRFNSITSQMIGKPVHLKTFENSPRQIISKSVEKDYSGLALAKKFAPRNRA